MHSRQAIEFASTGATDLTEANGKLVGRGSVKRVFGPIHQALKLSRIKAETDSRVTCCRRIDRA